MTCKEKAKEVKPSWVDDMYVGGVSGCPHNSGWLEKPDYCRQGTPEECEKCWNREIPEVSNDSDKDLRPRTVDYEVENTRLKDINEALREHIQLLTGELERYKLVIKTIETLLDRKIMEE